MDPDVLVLGGGPAGAAAAGMLARLGTRVTVLAREARWSIGESIPPSTVRLFAELGLTEAIERAGFLRSLGNTVWWHDAPARIEPYPPDSAGWQVERRRLDALLLDEATRAGATVLHGAVVTAVDLGDNGQAVTWRRGNGGEQRTHVPWVLDCTGRAGVLARRMGRETRPGHATFAVHAPWQGDRWEVPDVTHTLVETTAGGWAWSVPVTPYLRHVTVMIEPPAGTAEGEPLTRRYQAELAGTAHLAALTRNARMIQPPGALSAVPYVATRFGGPGWLLVGDAGSFIDPLSSYGVKKALAAAWLAAVVVHSALSEPALTVPAVALFARREREAFDELTRQAGRVWTGELPSGAEEAAPFRDDPGVHAAFTDLKRREQIALAIAGDVTIVPGPTVRGQRVVLEPHLRCGWQPEGIRYLRGIALPRLVELAPAANQVPDLYERYVRAEGATDLREFLGALSLLISRGVLVNGSASI